MRLHVLGSSSLGNGYILEGKNSALLMECGVPLKELTRTGLYDKIVGGFASHCHGDHSKYLDVYLNRAIRVMNNVLKHHNSIKIEHRKKVKFSDWEILPLLMVHDVECFGFIINHPEIGRVLFVTDTSEIPYKLSGINHIIIEANYSQELLDKKQLDHKINHNLATRIENSHLSFEKCSQWLIDIDKSKLETVTMIHLSNSNSQEEKFISELQEKIGVPIFCADKGSVITLNF